MGNPLLAPSKGILGNTLKKSSLEVLRDPTGLGEYCPPTVPPDCFPTHTCSSRMMLRL